MFKKIFAYLNPKKNISKDLNLEYNTIKEQEETDMTHQIINPISTSFTTVTANQNILNSTVNIPNNISNGSSYYVNGSGYYVPNIPFGQPQLQAGVATLTSNGLIGVGGVGYSYSSPDYYMKPPYRVWNPKLDVKPKPTQEIRFLFQIPVIFNTEIEQKHLNVWRQCNHPWDDDQYLADNMDTQFNLTGYLNFFKEEDANNFMVWWKRYLGFFHEKEYLTSTFPVMKKGKIDGYFVETITKEFMVEYSIMDNTKNSQVLEEQWIWIVKNTVEGAIQVNNGWIFKSETDATLFTLFLRV